jgi:septal ring factor EnvC (AmiA/AmiB activator)
MSKDYQQLLEMWREEKKKRQDLELINESHKKLNGKLQTELTETKEDNKKLSKQISHLEKLRKPF